MTWLMLVVGLVIFTVADGEIMNQAHIINSFMEARYIVTRHLCSGLKNCEHNVTRPDINTMHIAQE